MTLFVRHECFVDSHWHVLSSLLTSVLDAVAIRTALQTGTSKNYTRASELVSIKRICWECAYEGTFRTAHRATYARPLTQDVLRVCKLVYDFTAEVVELGVCQIKFTPTDFSLFPIRPVCRHHTASSSVCAKLTKQVRSQVSQLLVFAQLLEGPWESFRKLRALYCVKFQWVFCRIRYMFSASVEVAMRSYLV